MSEADEVSSRPTSRASWQAFVLVGVTLAVTQLAFYLTTAALPLYFRDIGAAQDRIGLEVGLGNLAGVVVTLLLGPAINRYGAERFFRLGAVCYVVSAAGMLLVPHEAAVTGFRVVQGFGLAMIGPSSFVLGARFLPDRPGTSIGVLGSLSSLALAAGPPIGLLLYVGHGAAWLFLPSIGIGFLGLAATALLPPVPARNEEARGFGFDRQWLPALISNFLAGVYFGGILAYLPLYLRAVHGPNAGIFFTADAIGVLLLRVPTGILADRYGSLVPRILGIVVTVPGIGALALPPSLWALAVAGACTGIGAGLFITGVLSDLFRHSTAANQGTAAALGNGSFSASIFTGSALSGVLIGPGGFGAVLLFGAITCAAALPLVLWKR